MTGVCLDLVQEDLLRLCLGQAADPFELPQVIFPGIPQLLGETRQLPFAIAERLLTTPNVCELGVERLLALEYALLQPHHLGAALPKFLLYLFTEPGEMFLPLLRKL
jgi:hypothetical protein